MGTGDLMLDVTRWTSIPSRGSRNIPGTSRHTTKNGISSSLMSHLARMQTLPTENVVPSETKKDQYSLIILYKMKQKHFYGVEIIRKMLSEFFYPTNSLTISATSSLTTYLTFVNALERAQYFEMICGD